MTQHEETEAYEDLVARCIELMDAQGSAAVEEELRSHPDQAGRVRSALKRLQSSGLLAPDDTPAEAAGVPERLGEFTILRRIGGGGMGVVFLARQESLDRQVALKVIRQDYLFFENARKRFQREVTAVSRLRHPGIVPVTHVGEAGGVPYFAMDYVNGCSLADVVTRLEERETESGRSVERKGSVMRELVASRPVAESTEGSRLFDGTWEQTCVRIALRVAEALTHAHDQGIIHRDVKPSNVMITAEGEVKVVDFGLATLETDERLTKSNALLGSLLYMSPEQVRQEAVDERTDVYSLGVTLYEVLALSPPFDAKDPGLREAILHGLADPLRRRSSTVSRDIETVVGTAISPARDRRYRSMRTFAEDLRNVLERRPIHASPPGLVRRATRWVQRHPLQSMATLLLVVVAAASSGLWWQQRRANELLTTEKQRREESLEQAVAAERKANAAMGRARKNLAAARNAIDEMLTQISDANLAVMPGAGPMRKRVIDTALRLYEELVADEPEAISLHEDLSDLECRVAEIQYHSGDFETGETMSGRAVQRTRELAEREPGLRSEFHLGRALTCRAGLRHRQHRYEDAMRDAKEALALMEPGLEQGVPGRGEAVVLEKLAEAYQQFEVLARQSPALIGEDPRFQRDFGRLAIGLRERVAKDHATRPLAVHNLGIAYWNLGLRLEGKGERDAAIAQFRKALKTLEPVATEKQAFAVTRSYYAHVLGSLGRSLTAGGRPWEAKNCSTMEIQILRDLARRYPDYIGFSSRLSAALGHAAGIALQRGTLEDADALCAEALRAQRHALSVLPKHAGYRGAMRELLLTRCRIDFQKRDAENLLLVAREFKKFDPVAGRGDLDAAMWILHAALLWKDDPERAERCRSEAVDQLVAASRTKFFRKEYLDAHIFRALAGRPRFEALGK